MATHSSATGPVSPFRAHTDFSSVSRPLRDVKRQPREARARAHTHSRPRTHTRDGNGECERARARSRVVRESERRRNRPEAGTREARARLRTRVATPGGLGALFERTRRRVLRRIYRRYRLPFLTADKRTARTTSERSLERDERASRLSTGERNLGGERPVDARRTFITSTFEHKLVSEVNEKSLSPRKLRRPP